MRSGTLGPASPLSLRHKWQCNTKPLFHKSKKEFLWKKKKIKHSQILPEEMTRAIELRNYQNNPRESGGVNKTKRKSRATF